jgi:hypothetical protein
VANSVIKPPATDATIPTMPAIHPTGPDKAAATKAPAAAPAAPVTIPFPMALSLSDLLFKSRLNYVLSTSLARYFASLLAKIVLAYYLLTSANSFL